MKHLKSAWEKLNDTLHWRGITWKDLGYMAFCIGSLLAIITLSLTAIISEVL